MTERCIEFHMYVDGVEAHLGHFDENWDESDNPARRHYQTATLLHQLAWDVEQRGLALEDFNPRKFEDSAGDVWFEVMPDKFITADSMGMAILIYNKNVVESVTLDDLQGFYPNLKEV